MGAPERKEMISKELLKSTCHGFGIELDEIMLERFDEYAARLVEFNNKVNLTAITEPEAIVYRHFSDSLTLLDAYSPKIGASLCDVGTGAGFPGAALLIVRNDLKLTLFDSVNKKLNFLRELLPSLGLSADIVSIRAEDAGKGEYREHFDVVTARAVAGLNTLSEYCVPLVKVGGVFAPMKTPLSDEERTRGKSALSQLGSHISAEKHYTLPDGSERLIIIAEKTSPTPKQFPRISAKISKSPL